MMNVSMGTMTITAANEVPFLVRIVREGERYGRNMAVVHNEPMPLVEFYDARYDHTRFGQFVSRYYADTVASGTGGLALQGDVPSWTIDGESMRYVRGFVRVATENDLLVRFTTELLSESRSRS